MVSHFVCYSPGGCRVGTGAALPLLLPLARRRQVELPDVVRRLQTEAKTEHLPEPA